MRKIKILVASLLFCAMSYAGYMGYERVTMSEAERFMQANVEALTLNEGTPSHSCARRSGPNGKLEQRMFCDSRTSATMIYPCPMASSVDFYVDGNMDRCSD